MHPSGFQLFAGASAKDPTLGTFDPYNDPVGTPGYGGYFAGLISHTQNGVATHALIVAPRQTGASGTGYPLTTNYQWKTSQTTTAGTTSSFDGVANTAAIVAAGIDDHPAAKFCVDLRIAGYSDWYLPARSESDIAYYHLKPSTMSNSTSVGSNSYSVPRRTSTYTPAVPAQTNVLMFQTTGSQPYSSSNTTQIIHWSSQELTTTNVLGHDFKDSIFYTVGKTDVRPVRAFRRLTL
jgi:hypothetical protein